jgi:hypothetical protein
MVAYMMSIAALPGCGRVVSLTEAQAAKRFASVGLPAAYAFRNAVKRPMTLTLNRPSR